MGETTRRSSQVSDHCVLLHDTVFQQHTCEHTLEEAGMSPKMETVTVSIRIPAEVKTALQDAATADDRSLNGYIGRALRQHLELQEAS